MSLSPENTRRVCAAVLILAGCVISAYYIDQLTRPFRYGYGLSYVVDASDEYPTYRTYGTRSEHEYRQGALITLALFQVILCSGLALWAKRNSLKFVLSATLVIGSRASFCEIDGISFSSNGPQERTAKIFEAIQNPAVRQNIPPILLRGQLRADLVENITVEMPSKFDGYIFLKIQWKREATRNQRRDFIQYYCACLFTAALDLEGFKRSGYQPNPDASRVNALLEYPDFDLTKETQAILRKNWKDAAK